jgi:hypothetical protein
MNRLITVLGLSLALFACAQKGPAERAGEALDDAADSVGDAARDVRDEAQDFADDVQDEIEDAR